MDFRKNQDIPRPLGHASNCPDLSQSMWVHPPHCYICMTLAGLLAFVPSAPDAGRHLLLLLRKKSRSTLQASFRLLIWNRPLPAKSRLSNSLAIPRDHWLQIRPHENLKGIPALQKHPEKCQPALPLSGLHASRVSTLLGSPVQKLTSLGSFGTRVAQQCSEKETGASAQL